MKLGIQKQIRLGAARALRKEVGRDYPGASTQVCPTSFTLRDGPGLSIPHRSGSIGRIHRINRELIAGGKSAKHSGPASNPGQHFAHSSDQVAIPSALFLIPRGSQYRGSPRPVRFFSLARGDDEMGTLKGVSDLRLARFLRLRRHPWRGATQRRAGGALNLRHPGIVCSPWHWHRQGLVGEGCRNLSSPNASASSTLATCVG